MAQQLAPVSVYKNCPCTKYDCMAQKGTEHNTLDVGQMGLANVEKVG